MCKLVRKSYTPVVPIANTCSIGYPHDGWADNAAYRHDRRADNAAYRHDRRADSLSGFAASFLQIRITVSIIFLISPISRSGSSRKNAIKIIAHLRNI